MTWKIDRARDRYMEHDYPAVAAHGFAGFVVDEIELGGRAAAAIDNPEQAWWEIHAEEVRAALEAAP